MPITISVNTVNIGYDALNEFAQRYRSGSDITNNIAIDIVQNPIETRKLTRSKTSYLNGLGSGSIHDPGSFKS
jgi:hypothetical protein